MPIREKRIYTGEFMEVEIYPITNEECRQPRRRKKKLESKEAQRVLNDKNSRKYLRWMFATNFTRKDFYITLSYSDENLPRTIEEAERRLKNYIERVNRVRKKRGLPNAKYVAITESNNGEKRIRVHHHIVMDCGLERELLEEKWGLGRVNTRALQPDRKKGYEELANYFCKQPRTEKGKKRWKQSKGNLVKPDIRINDNKFSMRKVRGIASCPEDNETFEKIYKGYEFSGCKVSINKMTDGIYLHIRMRKIQI